MAGVPFHHPSQSPT